MLLSILIFLSTGWRKSHHTAALPFTFPGFNSVSFSDAVAVAVGKMPPCPYVAGLFTFIALIFCPISKIPLTIQEGILLVGEISARQIDQKLKEQLPDRDPVANDTVGKFKDTGSVEDKKRIGRPKTVTDVQT